MQTWLALCNNSYRFFASHLSTTLSDTADFTEKGKVTTRFFFFFFLEVGGGDTFSEKFMEPAPKVMAESPR